MGTGRVLVIEDEAMVSMLLDDVVALAKGQVVGIAETVDVGLELVSQRNFDMVILDVNLVGESSEPIAEALRAMNVPVVVATGSHPGNLPDAYKGFHVAQKPFHMSEIIDYIEKLAF